MALPASLGFLRRRARAVGIGTVGLAAAVYGVRSSGIAEAEGSYGLWLKDGVVGAVGRTAAATRAAVQWVSAFGPSIPRTGDLATCMLRAVTELQSDQLKREVMYVLRQTPLVNWLLVSALKDAKADQHREATAALIALLSDGTTANQVLQSPGAVPLLFGHLTAVGWSGPLADAVRWAVHSGPPIKFATTHDIDAILQMLEPRMGWRTRRMAASMMSAWATASPGNCSKLMQAGAGPVLGSSAVHSLSGTDSQRAVQHEVVRAMDCLARRCPSGSSSGLHSWVEPLLYIAADASATKDQELACCAVEALAMCVKCGDCSEVRAALSRSNALPLLSMMAGASAADDTGRTSRAVVSSLAAIAAAGGAQLFSSSDREHWTALLLPWLLLPAEDGFTQSCSEVLAALSQADGQEGMWVAQQWLSTLLQHLVDHAALIARTTSAASASPSHPFMPIAKRRRMADFDEESAVSRAAISLEAARDVVQELRSASRAAVIVHEIPPEHEAHMSREAMLVYPELAAKVDAALAQEVTCKALTEMCILASGNRRQMRWLLDAGLLSVLKRITLLNNWQASTSGLEGRPVSATEATPLPVMQSTARMLSLLATERNLHHWIRDEDWGHWLRAGSASSDCRLSSCCTKTLLMLEAAQGDAAASIKNLSGFSAGLALLAGEHPQVGGPLVLHDGMHLLDPSAEHHRILAREGIGSHAEGAPLMDVLFVHGVRGNAFGTWRQLGGGHAGETISHERVWPNAWLKAELSDTRLLSYEYAAPVSNREGKSLPLDDLVESTTAKWLAAGLGQRPAVVVCHSLGGVLLKEVLRHCQRPNATAREGKLSEALIGAVFYGTPHFGTYLADIGWGLRYVAASPATVIRHLKPGAHHDPINEALRVLHDKGNLRVLSFGETIRTPLVSIAPWLSQDAAIKMEVVPMESAYPGIGDFVALHGKDHINACKPSFPSDTSYTRCRDFLQEALSRVRPTAAEGQGNSEAD